MMHCLIKQATEMLSLHPKGRRRGSGGEELWKVTEKKVNQTNACSHSHSDTHIIKK